MTSSDLQQRLFSLRNITQELKSSTASPSTNITHLKTLIGNLKQLSEPLATRSPKQNRADTYEQGYKKLINRNNGQENNGTAEDHQRILMAKRRRQSKQQMSDEQQIIFIREQNLRLEQKLGLLREELMRLQQRSDVSDSRTKKQLPFRQFECLNVFNCRFAIDQSDYSKIQYSAFEIELNFDRLILVHKQKDALEELDLTTLHDVIYLHSNIVVYRFQEFIKQDSHLSDLMKDHNPHLNDLTHLFIKYQSIEQLQKWDLSIFINFQIATSLRVKRLFESHFKKVRIHQEITSQHDFIAAIQISKEMEAKQQKKLLEIFMKRKENFLEIKLLIQEKLSIRKDNSNQNASERSKDDIPSPSLPYSHQKPTPTTTSNVAEQSQTPKIFDGDWKEEEREEIRMSMGGSISGQIGEKINNQVNTLQINKGTQPLQTRDYVISFSKQRAGEQSMNKPIYNIPSPSNFYASSPSYPYSANLVNNSEMKIDLIKSVPQNEHQANDIGPQSLNRISVTQTKINNARTNLQNGYYATKYSKDGYFTHEKKVFLSLDCRKLCWSEKDKQSEYKSIPLEVITRVDYGVIGSGIVKHVKRPDPLYFCLIEYYSSDQYKKKTIELGGNTPEQMRELTAELRLIISQAKGVPLSALANF